MIAEPFHYRGDALHVEGVAVEDIASEFGTPTYVYSRAAIERSYRQFTESFADHPSLACYAVKANSNLGVLCLLVNLGAGFDIVSGGELERVLRAGADPAKIVFSGVGKQPWEIRAALKAGIACFNVESSSELSLLETIGADEQCTVPISIRVNPDVDAKTHPYISTGLKENKFGVSPDEALGLYLRAASSKSLKIRGIDCHIGSQITQISPFVEALTRILDLVGQLAHHGISLEHIDLGGGVGVRYRDEAIVDPAEYASAILQSLGHRKEALWFEPGRFIVANAGILVCRVLHLKQNEHKRFAIVDAAMNDLIRPSLYGAWQEVNEVHRHRGAPAEWDIVGPVCETGDFLAKERLLTLSEGDLIAVRSAGAYGFAMSSNYNSRNRAAEIIVDGSKVQCVRSRETIDDQLRLERPYQF